MRSSFHEKGDHVGAERGATFLGHAQNFTGIAAGHHQPLAVALVPSRPRPASCFSDKLEQPLVIVLSCRLAAITKSDHSPHINRYSRIRAPRV
jgi:hypothetical protein